MRLVWMMLAVIALGACHQPTTLVSRPDDGYPAFRVKESRFVPFRLGGWQLQAGTTYVADRRRPDGMPIYCPVPMAGEPGTCVAWDGARMTFLADGFAPTEPIALPAGTIEETRLR